MATRQRRVAVPRLEKVRMTFITDLHTSRTLKALAKQSPYYLPDYIDQVVRRGLRVKATK